MAQAGGLIKGLAGQPPYLYLAAGPSLKILDVSDRANPRQVGEVLLADSTFEDVAVEDGLAVLVGQRGLWVVDVSDPTAPRQVSYSRELEGGFALEIDGTLAYVAINNLYGDSYGRNGFSIVDLTNPAAPALVGRLDAPDGVYALAVEDDLAYLSVLGGLQAVDVSDPVNPNVIGFYPQEYGRIAAIALAGDTGYLTALNEFSVLDLSDPTAPQRLGSTLIDSASMSVYGGESFDIAVAGDNAFVAMRGLNAVDVSNPISPTAISWHWAPAEAEDVFLDGDTAYLVVRGSELQVLDVADPRLPTQVGSWEVVPGGPAWDNASTTIPAGVPGSIIAVTIANDHLFAVEEEHKLWAFDLTNPAAPRPVGFKEMPGGFMQLTALDNFLIYVAKGGLWMVDASNPAALYLESACCPEGATWIDVQDTIGYMTTTENGLHVFDMANPAHPVEIGVLPSDAIQKKVVVHGSVAYVAETSTGGFHSPSTWLGRLRILDVSDPTQPKEISLVDTLGWVEDMAVVGDRVYLAEGGPGVVQVIDVSDPTQPTEVAVYETGTWTMHVIIIDREQAIVPIGGELYSFDLPKTGAAPGLPVLTLASTGAIVGDFVYIPADDQGLMVLRLPAPSNP